MILEMTCLKRSVMVSNSFKILIKNCKTNIFFSKSFVSFLVCCLIKGIKLRKVEKIEQKEKERSSTFHDVASILARRVAIELSESEDSDSDEDSECWVEPTETSA